LLDKTVYFKDTLFSSGLTEIFNEKQVLVGKLDLKSAFSSGIEILDLNGVESVSAKFPFYGLKWRVYNQNGVEIGSLKQKLTFLSKKFEYKTDGRGTYYIQSEAFSKQYEIYFNESTLIAKFEKISGFFSSPAFRLSNFSDQLSTEELIAVVMGVNAIQRRNNSATT
jgi:hypothetical protein